MKRRDGQQGRTFCTKWRNFQMVIRFFKTMLATLSLPKLNVLSFKIKTNKNKLIFKEAFSRSNSICQKWKISRQNRGREEKTASHDESLCHHFAKCKKVFRQGGNLIGAKRSSLDSMMTSRWQLTWVSSWEHLPWRNILE